MIVPYKHNDFNQPLKRKIQRTRYVVMRNNRTEIWCGLAKNFYFKPIQEIGNTSIKTYASEAKAQSSCSSWDKDYEVVPITEILEWEQEEDKCTK